MRKLILPLLLASSLALGGCAASIAASVAGAALRSANGGKGSAITDDLGPAAAKACEAHASQYGRVHIIDVERRSNGKPIVWGTVEDDRQKRSFECGYDGKISGFKLRAVQPR